MSAPAFEPAHVRADPQSFFARLPYAAWLGLEVAAEADGRFTVRLPMQDKIIGNPVLPALHGGVIGSLLELTASLQLVAQLEGTRMPKPVDISIDYLRSGKPVDSFCRATVFKQGRRVANVQAVAWQDDPEKAIAALHGHFLVPPPDA